MASHQGFSVRHEYQHRYSHGDVQSSATDLHQNCHLQDRKIAILLYGFPPGVGATGTAALLNVPASLAKLLEGLQQQGYDLGPDWDSGKLDGEAVISALKMQEEQRVIYEGKAGIEKRWCMHPSACFHACPLVCLSDRPSVHLSVYLSVCLSVCQPAPATSACLSASLSVSL